MKAPACVLFSGCFLPIVISACASRPAPFSERVWQLHSARPSDLREAIELASRYGVTGLQLSHDIVWDVEDLLDRPDRQAQLLPLVRLAKERGLEVTVWTHELNAVPESLRRGGRVDLDGPAVWEWLDAKYRRFFDQCPEVDGLVLTFHETEVSVYHDRQVISSTSPRARVARLIDALGAVCAARGKRLVVRTFCYEPSEIGFIRDGLAGVRTPITVMSKCQPHDWQPFYPHGPDIGDVGARPQIIEFDLGYEFLGQSRVPYCDLPYLEGRMRYAASKGARGAVLRVERHGFRARGTPNWANVAVFTRWLQEPGRPAIDLLREHLDAEYGSAAAPDLLPAFLATFDGVNRAYFPLGFWFTCHSRLSSYDYAMESLRDRGTEKWDTASAWADRKRRLMAPDAATVAEILTEKAEALRRATEAASAVERAKDRVTEGRGELLATYFSRLPGMVEVWSAHQEAFFQCRRWETRREPAAAAAARDAVRRLRALGERHGDLLIALQAEDGDPRTQSKRLAQFADEIERRTADAR